MSVPPGDRRVTRQQPGSGRSTVEGPSGRGRPVVTTVPVSTIDDLVARYTSMLGLLGDLSRRSDGAARPQALDEAMARCEARLSELRGHKLVNTPSAGIALRAEHQFLPGELLG